MSGHLSYFSRSHQETWLCFKTHRRKSRPTYNSYLLLLLHLYFMHMQDIEILDNCKNGGIVQYFNVIAEKTQKIKSMFF